MKDKSLEKDTTTSCDIAIIGLGCNYPGAKSPLQLWENILSRRQQFREMPDVRLPISDYYDPDPLVADKTYQKKAAVLDGYRFDWLDRKIPRSTYESTDIVHWLALDTALQALADARISKDSLPRETAGVIIGNTLTGEFTRSNHMLLRWPYVRKALHASLKNKGLLHLSDGLESTMEKYYKSVFAPVTEDTLAGGLANTIAGRVCNFLDLNGGGFIVDGACSSSLLAICTAANFLELRQMDMVIAGGVDISLDTFELIGFAKTGALTRDEMRVYDKDGKGFIPGEGCGMVVLKRLDDAIRDNNQVYAVLKGWGISSDGKGGITAPSAIGQSRALIRAYKKANFDPGKLNFIEGHGTGTTVGDKIELEGITIALNKNKPIPQRTCGVTSFKSIVGHTKAAAGVGAFIKTVIALNRRVIPPTAGLKELNPIFEDKAKTIYPVLQGQIFDGNTIMYAGVSAMGFGGINSHVLLQSGDLPFKKLQPVLDEKKLMVSNQSHELYIFAATNEASLKKLINEARILSKGISYAEMADFAQYNNSKADFKGTYRAATIASYPFELERKLNELLKLLEEHKEGSYYATEGNSIAIGKKNGQLKLGALYPGQGAQRINMAYKLVQRFDWAKELLEKADQIFKSVGTENVSEAIFRPLDRVIDNAQDKLWKDILKQTNIAQPAITVASLLWHKYLERLGVKIDIAAGHSLGELMAFHAAGFISEETLLQFAAFRGKAMANCGSGTMASLVCEKEKAETYIKNAPGYAAIANVNSPEQTVISGDEESINFIIGAAEADHIAAVKLPVSAAFHSKLIADTAKEIEKYKPLNNKLKNTANTELISSISGAKVVRETDLNSYFAQQCIKQVNFIDTVNAIKKECDVLIEIGPGKVLSGLSENIQKDIKSFPVEARINDDQALNVMLANIFVMGTDINVSELYNDRFIKDFVPAAQREFIVNPCERPFPDIQFENQVAESGFSSDFLIKHLDLSLEKFNDYLNIRADFLKEFIQTDMKYFPLKGNALSAHKAVQSSAQTNFVVPQPQNKISSNNNSSVKQVLYSKIETITGFPSNGFTGNMKLLDDFNLDSIKAGSLLNGIFKDLEIQGKLNPSNFLNASLEDITTEIEKITGKTEATSNNSIALISNNDIQQFVFKQIEEKTGFPQSALKPEFKLLDDLNLDSIKAGSFIVSLLKQFDLQGKIEPAKFANASLTDIIDQLSSLLSTTQIPTKSVDNSDNINNKVSSYSVNLSVDNFPIDEDNIKSYWINKKIALVCTKSNLKFAEEFRLSVANYANCNVVDYKELLNIGTDYQSMFVLLPENKNTDKLLEVTELLTQVAHYQYESLTDVGFVQIGDGYFARAVQNKSEPVNSFSAVAFTASLHLERPTIKFRAIEVNEATTADYAGKLALNEFLKGSDFFAAGFDKTHQRRIMEYQLTDDISIVKRSITLNENDIVLVTGGAKGITSECALAFAKKHKCKMALVGSSVFNGEDGEIKNILGKYSSENLTAMYFSCNIVNESSARNLLKQITKELGTVTAIIHGAGKNVPRRTETISHEQVIDEISPKIIGAINILNATNASKLKYFVAFTSIIGVTGMAGNSWYAFSNEALDLFLRNIKQKYGIETVSLAYSIWSEVGMGERMGSTVALAKMGIGAINPRDGINQFLTWTEQSTNDQQIVIAAGMGTLDTWVRKLYSSPAVGRYLQKVLLNEPGIEVKVRSILSQNTDIYIDDHNYKGSLLFPTVFGLEAMAQAVSLVTGITKFSSVRLENISLHKPIVVPQNGETEIEINAIVIEADTSNKTKKVKVGISTEYSNFIDNHFSATFIVGLENMVKPKTLDIKVSDALPINPVNDLYGWLLFQGPRFQLIDKVYQTNNASATFSIKKLQSDSSEVCFSKEKQLPMLLGSPLLRDTLLQSVQLILTKQLVLPISIESWEIKNPEKQPQGGKVQCTLTSWDENTGQCNVVLVNENKEVVEEIIGYTVKAMEAKPSYPTPLELNDINSLVNKKILDNFSTFSHLLDDRIEIITYKHQKDFNMLPKAERQTIEQEVYHKFVSNNVDKSLANSSLSWASDGKPSIDMGDNNISISHSMSLLILALGKSPQGCDIELVQPKDKDEWQGIIEKSFAHTVDHLTGIDNDYNQSYTRLWGVQETCIKAFGILPQNIAIKQESGSGIVFEVTINNKAFHILTFPVSVFPDVMYMVTLLVTLKTKQIEVVPESKYSIDNIFDPESQKFVTMFFTAFKDCRGFFGKTYFTDFPLWMGNLREYILTPVKKQLLKDLGSGEFGMVTNDSKINIYGEADTLDKITGRLWITQKSDLKNSLIDLGYEWLKHTENGEIVKIADCELSTTWVKIEERGIVKLSPIPEYFYTYLDEHLKRGGSDHDNYPRATNLSKNDLGNLIYKSATIPRPSILLIKKVYQTGLYNGNTVGNLYYSNYYDWQAKNIESYIYKVMPEIFLENGKVGEYICLESNVNHLQEAMPFEEIEVNMFLEKIYEKGLVVYFEYYSLGNNNRRKLAYGHNTLLWAKRTDETSTPIAHKLPGKIQHIIIELTNHKSEVTKIFD